MERSNKQSSHRPGRTQETRPDPDYVAVGTPYAGDDDFHDLLNAIDTSILVLDRGLRVKGFSPSAAQLFDLSPDSKGSPLLSIASKIDRDTLEADCRNVMETRVATEREVQAVFGLYYLARTAPIRTADGVVNGVVVTFEDITERKAAVLGLEMAHNDMEHKVRERTRELKEEIEERKAAERNVRRLLRRLVDVQEEERKRIARDIHDQMGQELTALRIHLESLRMVSNSAELDAQISKALKCAQDLDQSVDYLTWELRPASLDHLGLAPALDELVKSWSDRFGIPAEFHATSTENLRLSPEAEANLYLFAREALHNIYKHADAKNAGLMFERRGGQVVMIVEDDGRGFDPDSVAPGVGLVSMRERARLIGADVEIESNPGQGTSVYVRLPLERDESEPLA